MEKIFTDKGKLKIKYFYVLHNLLTTDSNRLYLKHWRRYKRNHYALDDRAYWRTRDILDHFNIPYTLGNSAERAGAEGDYIELTGCGSGDVNGLIELGIKELELEKGDMKLWIQK